MIPPDESHWLDVQRLEAWAGEVRVNLIRIVALAVFYARHLIEFLAFNSNGHITAAYHERVTWICLLWAGTAAVLHYRLMLRQVAPAMKYIATIVDTTMLTMICALGPSPRTPLAVIYFLIVATTPLRLSLSLVYFGTFAAIFGYLAQVALYAWGRIGFAKYYATPELRVPRSEEAIIVLALAAAGLLAGQYVRQARRLVERYPVTVAEETRAESERR
jgi:hypothetical protein